MLSWLLVVIFRLPAFFPVLSFYLLSSSVFLILEAWIADEEVLYCAVLKSVCIKFPYAPVTVSDYFAVSLRDNYELKFFLLYEFLVLVDCKESDTLIYDTLDALERDLLFWAVLGG